MLLADDEQCIRELLSIKLSAAGHTVLVAKNGAEALKIAKQECPDVVIADYHMPGFDGWELAASLHMDPGTNRIPVIMLTGDDFVILRQPIGDRNIHVLFNKPFSIHEIVQVLSDLALNRYWT